VTAAMIASIVISISWATLRRYRDVVVLLGGEKLLVEGTIGEVSEAWPAVGRPGRN